MTAPTAIPAVDAIDAALARAVPRLSEDGQRLAGAVLRLLARVLRSARRPPPRRRG